MVEMPRSGRTASAETPAFPVFMEITLSTKYFFFFMEMLGTKPRALGRVKQVSPVHCLFPQTQNTFLPPSSSRMTILSSHKWGPIFARCM